MSARIIYECVSCLLPVCFSLLGPMAPPMAWPLASLTRNMMHDFLTRTVVFACLCSQVVPCCLCFLYRSFWNISSISRFWGVVCSSRSDTRGSLYISGLEFACRLMPERHTRGKHLPPIAISVFYKMSSPLNVCGTFGSDGWLWRQSDPIQFVRGRASKQQQRSTNRFSKCSIQSFCRSSNIMQNKGLDIKNQTTHRQAKTLLWRHDDSSSKDI